MRIRTKHFWADQKPWYRLRPVAALLVAAVIFAAISTLRWFHPGSGEALTVLFVLPIALMAVTFGLRGGLASATLGFAIFAMFALFHGNSGLDAEGWVVRGVAMFLLGGLLGRAIDQSRSSEQATLTEQTRRCQVEDVNRRYVEAFELSDSILQHIAVAKWMLEQGRSGEAAEILGATIERGQRMVAGLLPVRIGPSEVSDAPEASRGGREGVRKKVSSFYQVAPGAREGLLARSDPTPVQPNTD